MNLCHARNQEKNGLIDLQGIANNPHLISRILGHLKTWRSPEGDMEKQTFYMNDSEAVLYTKKYNHVLTAESIIFQSHEI